MPANLMMLLPPYFQRIYEYEILMGVEESELDAAEKSMEQVKKNLYVQTCDDMTLREYERLLGIVRQAGTSMDRRRQMVLSRMNQQPPYTLPKLKEILNAAVGVGGYRLDVRYGIYEMELDVIDQPYQPLKNIQYMVENVIPANLVFIFAGKYPFKIPVESAAGTCLELASDFYTQYNREFLYLNGSWPLDGAYLLNGYKEIEGLDLYPARGTVRGEWLMPVASTWQVGYWADAKGLPETETDMRIVSETAGQLAGDAGLGLAWVQPVTLGVGCHLTVEKDLWYLDGKYLLDGTKLLDAGIFEYEL